jgi:hypothetical protein
LKVISGIRKQENVEWRWWDWRFHKFLRFAATFRGSQGPGGLNFRIDRTTAVSVVGQVPRRCGYRCHARGVHTNIRRLQARGLGGFCECGGHGSAEIGIGQQTGDLGFPLRLCRRDEASYLLISRDAKWPNAWLGLRCVIGERQNWNSSASGDRSD